jgi:hypothetical protein
LLEKTGLQAAQKDLPGNRMLEYWSVGILGIKSTIPLFHRSNISAAVYVGARRLSAAKQSFSAAC